MIENLNGIHETVKYKEYSNVKLFINAEAEDYPIHWHTPMEIIMPLEGGYTVQIGDDLVHLNENDIIFIASGVKHRLIAPDTGKRLILQIEWSAVSKIKELNSILTLIAPAITLTPETSGDIHSNIRKLLLDISNEYQTDSFLSEAVIYSKMLEVLVLIGRHHTASSCNFNVGRHKQQEYLERFLSICEYIDTHCTEDITLDEISKIAGFSKYHFTRLFKQIEWSAVSKIKELNSILTLIAPAITLTPETSGDIHSNIRKLLLDISNEYQTDSFLSEAVIYSKMLEVLVLIGRHHTASSCNFNVGRHKQQEYLERFLSICEYIDTHCTEDITLDEISKIAGFSKYHFTRLFKQFTNNTFYKYLNQKRIELALTLLADPNISVTETAMQSGFANPSTFIRVFKAEKGCTPTEFRKMFIG